MKLCAICQLPILSPHRVRTCGPLCAKDWERAYHRQYHADHRTERNARHAHYNRLRAPRARQRKPLTEEQQARRRERDRIRRATPEAKAKRRAERLNWTPEQRARWLESKRRSRQKRARLERLKRRERHQRNPSNRNEYAKKYARRNQVAWQVLKALGVNIDVNTLEVTHANGSFENGFSGSASYGSEKPDGITGLVDR